MATNEKVLQTRIVNKHALLTDWESSTLLLKEGEIALAKVMVAQKDGTTAPTYIAKVGLEGKTFNESPMFFAPASDVHAWAKASTKPTYAAGEIKLSAGTTVEAEITTLKTAVGTGGEVDTKISTAITTALDALDLAEVTVGQGMIISKIKQENGKVTVDTRPLAKEDIPTIEIAQVNGLQAVLDAKAVKATVDQEFIDIKARLDSGDIHTGIVNAQAAADAIYKAGEGEAAATGVLATYMTSNNATLAEVKATAEAARTKEEVDGQIDAKITAFNTNTINPIDQRVTNNATAIAILAGEGNTATVKGNAEAIAALAGEGNTSTVKANAEAIADLAQRIGNVANVMNFRGVSTSETVGADITDPKAGDVIIYGEAEYVYDETGKWVKFGDASDNATAITELDQRVTTVETDLGTTGRVTRAIEAAQGDATQALADALTANTAIEVINGTGAGSIAKAVDDATDTLKKYAEAEAADAEEAAKSYVDLEVAELEKADTATNTKIDNHIAATGNVHGLSKGDIELGNVENKSTATIKSEFTGAVAADNDGFVTGGAVHTAIEAAKSAANGYTDTEIDRVEKKADDNATQIGTIKNNYARVSGNQLVYGLGTEESPEYVIIFDCGGAQ